MRRQILISIWGLLFIPVLSQNYVPGTKLLEDERGEVKWGQHGNNNYTCTPTYNEVFSPGSTCGHVLAGCGAVAMGQIMWKWQYPQGTSIPDCMHAGSPCYRTFDWNLMPATLKDTTPYIKGMAISNLLKGCADAIHMLYYDNATGIEFIDELFNGSSSTISNIEDAFKNEFNYKSVKKHSKSDWDYGSAWEDLIRSEINAGRPVFYNGMKDWLCLNGHFFVIDGYSSVDRDSFHINFGWRGKYADSHYKLNN
jgi:hypothetical protein